jgi:hypothetical protein
LIEAEPDVLRTEMLVGFSNQLPLLMGIGFE